jgi:hypothetical protein
MNEFMSWVFMLYMMGGALSSFMLLLIIGFGVLAITGALLVAGFKWLRTKW